jgi:outer membrane protein assembly factor BamD
MKTMQFSLLKTGLEAVGRLFAALGMVLLICQCVSQTVNPDDPDSLFAEAQRLLKDEQYLIAVEKLRDIKNRFPYSPRATDAELAIADAYFAQESFLEAESAYEIFRELHPSYPRSDFVQYQIGMSYFNLIPENSARDLSAAYRAIDAFNLLKQRFPDSKLAQEADGRIADSRKRLAEHESFVANFYYDRRHYLSASYRYAALLKDFSNVGYDEEALYRLGQCYYNIRQYDNAKDSLDKLMKQYPESGYVSSAKSLMEDINKKN